MICNYIYVGAILIRTFFSGYACVNGDDNPQEQGGIYQQPDSPLHSSAIGEEGDSPVGFPNSDNSMVSSKLNSMTEALGD